MREEKKDGTFILYIPFSFLEIFGIFFLSLLEYLEILQKIAVVLVGRYVFLLIVAFVWEKFGGKRCDKIGRIIATLDSSLHGLEFVFNYLIGFMMCSSNVNVGSAAVAYSL